MCDSRQPLNGADSFRCGICDKDLAWHARKADWLRNTIGPAAELEFEEQHWEEE